MVYDKHFVSSPPKDTTSPTSSASSESSEDYIPGRDLLETERYTRFQRELAQRIAGYAPTSGLAPRVALPVAPCVAPRVALPIRISTQAREDEDDYEEDEEEWEEEYTRDSPAVPAETRHRVQVSQRDQRARLRSQRQGWEELAPEAAVGDSRRSTRRPRVTYAESSPESGSSRDRDESSVSPCSEGSSASPSPRGVKRKRAGAAKDGDDEEEVPKTGGKRRTTKRIVEDSDDEMAEASRSRSITPAPPIMKRGTRRTTLADSDDEMTSPSASRSRSATPAPPVKKRKVEGKKRTVLEDSDDEME